MMKIRYLRAFISALTLCLLLIGGLNQDTFGQGKGKGGGNPHGGPPGQQKHGGGGDQGGRGNGGGWQQQRQQPQPQPQAQPQQAFRQPEFRTPPGQARKQERVFQQQPAPQQVWRQQAPRQVWRQQEYSAPQAYRMPPGQAKKQQQQAYIPAPVYQDRGKGNGRGKWQRENVAPPWSGGWVPPGQIRSAEVHERNAIRKAEKEAAKAYGRQYTQPYYAPYVPSPTYRYDQYGGSYGYTQPYYSQRYSQPYYSAPSYQAYEYYIPQYVEPYRYSGGGYLNYSPLYVPNTYIYEPYTAYATYPNYYGYSSPYYGYNNGGFDWKSMLVRTLIGFVLGNGDNDYYGQGPYAPYYANAPAYSGYGYSPSYGGYYPTSYSMRTSYVQPVYDYSGYDVPLVNTMPMQDLFGPSYGGYSSGTLREVLAQGYEQGYQAGWYARENQLRDHYLANGYRAEDDYYDPYSYSIGENRRCFSEGYAIGYQDALNGRNETISQYTGGTDLLSLLLSNVIGTV